MAPKFSFLFFLALLLSNVSAIKIVNITDVKIERQVNVFPEENPADIIDLHAVHQSSNEAAEFAASSFSTGFARVVRACVRVQRGSRATLNYRIRARGVDAQTIATSDSTFSSLAESLLTTEQSSTFTSLRESFTGRLNIPFLQYLGFNLRESFSTSTAMSIRSDFGASAYSSLTTEAVNILSTFTESNVIITGSLEAIGDSFIPVEACAFLQFSRVEFGENESTNVFSTNTQDLVAATSSGRMVPSENGDIVILDPTRRR